MPQRAQTSTRTHTTILVTTVVHCEVAVTGAVQPAGQPTTTTLVIHSGTFVEVPNQVPEPRAGTI